MDNTARQELEASRSIGSTTIVPSMQDSEQLVDRSQDTVVAVPFRDICRSSPRSDN